jgi:hypothetical protein
MNIATIILAIAAIVLFWGFIKRTLSKVESITDDGLETIHSLVRQGKNKALVSEADSSAELAKKLATVNQKRKASGQREIVIDI